MPAALDPPQHVEKLVRRHQGDWTIANAGKELEEPARFLDGGRREPFALPFLDILLRDEAESGLCRQFGL